MAVEYFTAAGNERQGPFALDALDERIRQGLLGPDTLVWTEGMAGWQKAREVDDLVRAYPSLGGRTSPPPPPMPPEFASVGSNFDRAPPVPRDILAPFSERFLAGLIDTLVLIIPIMVVGSLIPYVGAVGVSAAYYVYFMSEKGGGQTLGYKAMKIRLASEATGRAPELGDTVLWWLVYWFIGIISWIWYFFDDRKRMLHNMASKTVAVRA